MKVDKNKVKIFYSYSHKDELLRDNFECHMSGLKRKGLIEEWHDRKIIPGEFWGHSINNNIEDADIVLFLISSDFLASDYCYNKEVIKAVERHNKGLCTVVPIILRECDWEGTPFETIQGLPTDMKPIVSKNWHNIDEAFTNVVKGVKKIIHTHLESRLKSELNTKSIHKEDHNDLNVNFRDSISGREVSVMLDKSMKLSEVIKELIASHYLQEGNVYFCKSKFQDKVLNNESTFNECNIIDNDTIIIGVNAYAG